VGERCQSSRVIMTGPGGDSHASPGYLWCGSGAGMLEPVLARHEDAIMKLPERVNAAEPISLAQTLKEITRVKNASFPHLLELHHVVHVERGEIVGSAFKGDSEDGVIVRVGR
jgi:hypothetical protein